MNLLVYCIFRRGSKPPDTSLTGVGGQGVFLVEEGRLAAAVSGVCRGSLTVDPAEVMTYANVVGILHRSVDTGGVIPMRYGNLLAGEAVVRRHLTCCKEEYAALLRSVAGCEEMGLRLLLPEPSCDHIAPAESRGCEAGTSGIGYLAARKGHYAARETLEVERNLLTERCRGAFDGQFVNWKAERRAVTDPQTRHRQTLLSLVFLVPRGNLPLFLQSYRELRPELPERALLSGPWPPYNFVQAQRAMA